MPRFLAGMLTTTVVDLASAPGHLLHEMPICKLRDLSEVQVFQPVVVPQEDAGEVPEDGQHPNPIPTAFILLFRQLPDIK